VHEDLGVGVALQVVIALLEQLALQFLVIGELSVEGEGEPLGLAAVLALPALGGAGAGAGGIVAACTSNPLGWIVCGSVAVATVGYVGWELYKNWCEDGVVLESKRKGDRNWAGSPKGTPKPDKGIKGVPGRPGWGQQPNRHTQESASEALAG